MLGRNEVEGWWVPQYTTDLPPNRRTGPHMHQRGSWWVPLLPRVVFCSPHHCQIIRTLTACPMPGVSFIHMWNCPLQFYLFFFSFKTLFSFESHSNMAKLRCPCQILKFKKIWNCLDQFQQYMWNNSASWNLRCPKKKNPFSFDILCIINLM